MSGFVVMPTFACIVIIIVYRTSYIHLVSLRLALSWIYEDFLVPFSHIFQGFFIYEKRKGNYFPRVSGSAKTN